MVGHRYWIAVVFCLLAAAPGSWVPVLSNVLKARGWDSTITWAFLIPPIAGMISPLVFGARADQRIAAEKLLGIIITAGSIFLYLAFLALEKASSPWLFLVLLMCNALIAAPGWALLTTIALTSLETEKRSFGLYRVWGTIGWVLAGLTVSGLHLDLSPEVGKVAAGVRVLAGMCCFLLPHTPPLGVATRGLRSALGLDALSILRDPDHRVYIITTFLLSVPLAAFYMHTPIHLKELGMERVARGMTLGQVTETAALLVMGLLIARMRLKWLFTLAIACGVARYGLFAVGGTSPHLGWILGGVALHGLCYTFFFETGRVFLSRRVDPGLRAQVQALLTFVSFGMGSLVGTLVCGALYDFMVEAHHGGWAGYWGLLAGMCVAAGLYFLLGYKGMAAGASGGGPTKAGR